MLTRSEIDKRNEASYQSVYNEDDYSTEVMSFLKETVEEASLSNYEYGRVLALIFMSACYMSIGDYDDGYPMLESIDKDWIEDKATAFLRMNYYSGYMIYFTEYKGDFKEGLMYMNKELKAAEEYGDKTKIMRIHMNLATVYALNGYYEVALERYKDVREYAKSIHDQYLINYISYNLAETYLAMGDLENAAKYYRESLEYAKDQDNDYFHWGSLFSLAKIAGKQGDYKKALALHRYTEEVAFPELRPQDAFEQKLDLAGIYQLDGQLERAVQEMENLMEMIDEIENNKLKLQFYEFKAEVNKKRDDYQEAYEALEKYLELYKEEAPGGVAKSVEKAVHADYKRQEDRLNALVNIGKELTKLTDLDDMLLKLKEEFETLLSADSIGIGLVEGNKLTFEHYFDNGVKLQPRSTSLDSKVSLAVWCAKNKQALIINDIKNEYSKYIERIGILDQKKDDLINSVMIGPLFSDDKVFGVFTVQSRTKNAYSAVEAKIYSVITDYLAIAVNNARQRQALEKLSVRDNLTGLLNRRGFIDYYNEEVVEAGVEVKKLALIMLDLDFFKSINDTYGHLVGDDVLRAVSEVLQSFDDDGLVTSRLGGEEFAMLVLNKDMNEAMTLAESVRLSIEDLNYHLNDQVVKVTASFGLVAYDVADDISYDALYFEADKALYKAKAKGRNRVEIYE